MKLGNIFDGNSLTLSRSPHGSLQNNKSIDFSPLTAKVPTGYPYWKVERVYKGGSARYNGFHLVSPGGEFDILFHHCNPLAYGVVYPGAWIARSTWHHIHSAAKAKGIWNYLVAYMSPDIVLAPEPGGGVGYWNKRSSYGYLELPNTAEARAEWVLEVVGNDIQLRIIKGNYIGRAFITNISKGTKWDLWLNSTRKKNFIVIKNFYKDLYEVDWSWQKKQIDMREIQNPCQQFKDQIVDLTNNIKINKEKIDKLTVIIDELNENIRIKDELNDQLVIDIDTLKIKVENQKKELAKNQLIRESGIYKFFKHFIWDKQFPPKKQD